MTFGHPPGIPARLHAQARIDRNSANAAAASPAPTWQARGDLGYEIVAAIARARVIDLDSYPARPTRDKP